MIDNTERVSCFNLVSKLFVEIFRFCAISRKWSMMSPKQLTRWKQGKIWVNFVWEWNWYLLWTFYKVLKTSPSRSKRSADRSLKMVVTRNWFTIFPIAKKKEFTWFFGNLGDFLTVYRLVRKYINDGVRLWTSRRKIDILTNSAGDEIKHCRICYPWIMI